MIPANISTNNAIGLWRTNAVYFNIGNPAIARAGMMIIHQSKSSKTNLAVRPASDSETSSPTPAVELITPVLEEQRGGAEEKHGGVVIGTIAGDIHTIGKDIVATMLKIAGFELYDLGRDVAIESYVNKAKEVDADIVASSALMTPTMTEQLTLEEQLKEAGIRDKVKTMIGCAPVSQKWADEIGADIYAENAADAVKKAKEAVK